MNTEKVVEVSLGIFDLFYPLLMASAVAFVYALIKRSWKWMLFSAVLLYPDVWFLSGYPLLHWAKWMLLIHVALAGIFYFSGRKSKTGRWIPPCRTMAPFLKPVSLPGLNVYILRNGT